MLRGRFVLKTNGRMSSITWNKDHCCSFFTSWVIKQQTKLYIEHFEKAPNFGRMVRTPKTFFRVLQIITRVLQVPIFRNNFHFGWKVFTFSGPALQKLEKFDVHQGQMSQNLKWCHIHGTYYRIVLPNICYLVLFKWYILFDTFFLQLGIYSEQL